MKGPTEKQMAILRFIDATVRRLGRAPVLREIASEIGVSSTNGVSEHLRALERKGLLGREMLPGKQVMTNRGLWLTVHAKNLLAGVETPPCVCRECGRAIA